MFGPKHFYKCFDTSICMSDFEYMDDDDFDDEVEQKAPNKKITNSDINPNFYDQKGGKKSASVSSYSSDDLFNSLNSLFETSKTTVEKEVNKPSEDKIEKPKIINKEVITESTKLDKFRDSALEVFNYSSQYVIGQDEALKQMIIPLLKYKFRGTIENKKGNKGVTNPAYLIYGPPGSGKTFSIRTVCNAIDLPFLEVNSTFLTQAGYKGNNVSELLDFLLPHLLSQNQKSMRANDTTSNNNENSVYGIIFLDEFMKKGFDNGSGGESTVFSKKVYDELLKVIEPGYQHNFQGQIYNLKVIFVLADAMASLGNIEVTEEILIKQGISPELTRRILILARLKELDIDDLEKILKSKKGQFISHLKEAEDTGLHIHITCDAIKRLAFYSLKENGGASNLNKNVELLFNKLFYEITYNPKFKSINKISINEHAIDALFKNESIIEEALTTEDQSQIEGRSKNYNVDYDSILGPQLQLKKKEVPKQQVKSEIITQIKEEQQKQKTETSLQVDRPLKNYEVLLKSKYPVLLNQAFEKIEKEIKETNKSLELATKEFYDMHDIINQVYSTTYDSKIEFVSLLKDSRKEIKNLNGINNLEQLSELNLNLKMVLLKNIDNIIEYNTGIIKQYTNEETVSYLIPNLEQQLNELNLIRKKVIKTIEDSENKIQEIKTIIRDYSIISGRYSYVYDRTLEAKNTFNKCKFALNEVIRNEEIEGKVFYTSSYSLRKTSDKLEELIDKTKKNIDFCGAIETVKPLTVNFEKQLKELNELSDSLEKFILHINKERDRIYEKWDYEYHKPFCKQAEEERNEIISELYSKYHRQFEYYKLDLKNIDIDLLIRDVEKVINEYKNDYYVGYIVPKFEGLLEKIKEAKGPYKEINEIKDSYYEVLERINKYKDSVHKYVAKETYKSNISILEKVRFSLVKNNSNIKIPKVVIDSDQSINHLKDALEREFKFTENLYTETIKMSKEKPFEIRNDFAKFAMEIQSTLNEIDSFKKDLSDLNGTYVPDIKFLDIYFAWMAEKCPSASFLVHSDNNEIIKYDQEWKNNIQFKVLKLITEGILQKPERYYEPLLNYLESTNAYSTIDAIAKNEKINFEAREKALELSCKLRKSEQIKKHEDRIKKTLRKKINV